MTSTANAVGYQPGAPEMRMFGAVARQSICDAWQRGEDRSAFHGYCIATRRIAAVDDGHALFVLTLRITGAASVLDRHVIAVASHPIPGSAFHLSFDGARLIAKGAAKSLTCSAGASLRDGPAGAGGRFPCGRCRTCRRSNWARRGCCTGDAIPSPRKPTDEQAIPAPQVRG